MGKNNQRLFDKLGQKEIGSLVEDFIGYHNNLWEENAKKTSTPYKELESCKKITLPLISSNKIKDETFVFIGPSSQIPKYRVNWTKEMIKEMQIRNTHPNGFLAYLSKQYSVLIEEYDVDNQPYCESYQRGLGRIAWSSIKTFRKFPKKFEENSVGREYYNNIFSSELKSMMYFLKNHRFATIPGYPKGLTEDKKSEIEKLPLENKSLLVIVENADFARWFCDNTK